MKQIIRDKFSNVFQTIRLLHFVLLMALLQLNMAFYFTVSSPILSDSSQLQNFRCFKTIVFKQECLLIQLQLPIFKRQVQAFIQVRIIQGKKQKSKVLNEKLKDPKYKYTVKKQNFNIGQVSEDHFIQYETCILLKEIKTVLLKEQTTIVHPDHIEDKSALQNPLINVKKQSYVFSLKLLTNFSHILHQKRSSQGINKKIPSHKYKKQNLQKVKKYAMKLSQISKEQVQLHRENEKKQIQIQKHINQIQDSIYNISLMQSAILVCGNIMHINLLRKYLKGAGLI